MSNQKEATILPAKPKACSECPWRISNHGKKHPGKWYSKTNLNRLWNGLRDGVDMSCHPTDTRMNEWPWRPVPEGVTAHECTGGLIVKQREFMKFQAFVLRFPSATAGKVLRWYHAENPRGMTRYGLMMLVERAIFGGVPMIGGLKMSKPDLNDPEIGHPTLKWKPMHESTTAKKDQDKLPCTIQDKDA